MNLKEYVRGLVPRMKKRELIDEIDSIVSDLNDTVIPAYEQASDFFGEKKLLAKWNEEFDNHFKKSFKIKYKGNFIKAINETLPLLMENLNSIRRLSDKVEDNWSKDSVSLLTLNLMKSVNHTEFLVKYARRLLNVSLTMEMNIGDGKKELEDILKFDMEWLNANKTMFIGVYSIMTMNRSEIQKRLSEIPEVFTGEETADMAESLHGSTKTDSLGLGLIPLPLNIFYRGGKLVAEWQASRYKKAIAERDAIQMRLIYLRQLEQGNPDPIMRKEIEITQSRVDKLNYEINEMEEKWID